MVRFARENSGWGYDRIAGETGTPLLDEVLLDIGAIERPDWRDHCLSDLALALRSRRSTEAALQVIRMIQSPITRSESAVNPESLVEIDPASVQEALMAVTQMIIPTTGKIPLAPKGKRMGAAQSELSLFPAAGECSSST